MTKIKNTLMLLLLFLLPTQLGTFFFIPESIIQGIPIDLLAPALYLTDILVIILVFLHVIETNTPRHHGGTPLKGETSIDSNKSSLEGGGLKGRRVLGVLFAIGVLLILNLTMSLSPLISAYKLLKIAELIALFWMVKKNTLDSKYVLTVFLAMAIIELTLGLAQMVGGHALQGLWYFLGERSFSLTTPGMAKVSLQGVEILRPYGTFSHPNSLAGFYLLIYSFVIFSPPSSSAAWRIQKNLLLIVTALLVVFSFSKVAILGYVIVSIANAMRKKTSCALCKLSGIILPIVLAGTFMLAQGDPATIEKRLWLASGAFTIMREHILTGVGLGNYLIAQGTFPIPYSYHFLQPVHNIFLLLMVELGIPLFILTSYFLIPAFKYMWKSPTFKAVLFVIIFTGMFDHYWLTLQQNMLLLPVMFGLMQRGRGVI